MSFYTSALILTWVVLILMGFVIAGLVRQVHELSSATRRTGAVGLRPGSPAPGLDRLGVHPPATLLFVSEGCATCREVLERVDGSVHVLYAGEVPAGFDGYGGQADLFEQYDAIATPFAVVVDDAGRVTQSGPVGSPDALTSLLGGRS
jgi:hypothetical protein